MALAGPLLVDGDTIVAVGPILTGKVVASGWLERAKPEETNCEADAGADEDRAAETTSCRYIYDLTPAAVVA